MSVEEREEWADLHGYRSGRCPRCHATVWSDGGLFVCGCGASSATEDDEEDEQ